MLKHLSLFILLISASLSSMAHYMWIETEANGQIGKAHTINVYFGEYTYGLMEDPSGDHFAAVKNFKLWIITPKGKKLPVDVELTEKGYSGTFSPTEKGTYVAVLNNNEIDVIDYTEYDFGIFKTHYHSTANINVGISEVLPNTTNSEGLSIVDLTTNDMGDRNLKLQVFYKGEPFVDAEVSVFMQDQWSKTIHTDEEGKISFTLPFSTKYILEVTNKEEVPGSYKGEDYEFIWHCATKCFNLTKN